MSYWFSLCRMCVAHRHLGQVPSACRSLGSLLQGHPALGSMFQKVWEIGGVQSSTMSGWWAAVAPGSGSCGEGGLDTPRLLLRVPCAGVGACSPVQGSQGRRGWEPPPKEHQGPLHCPLTPTVGPYGAFLLSLPAGFIQRCQAFQAALGGKTRSGGWKLKLGKHILEMRHF